MILIAVTLFTPENAQILAGAMFAGAYVPQIMRMRSTGSSADVSLVFLVTIIAAILLSTWYALDLFFPQGDVPVNWKIFPFLLSNVLNFIMVVTTLVQALKLRK